MPVEGYCERRSRAQTSQLEDISVFLVPKLESGYIASSGSPRLTRWPVNFAIGITVGCVGSVLTNGGNFEGDANQ
jgi:hypothetical protein